MHMKMFQAQIKKAIDMAAGQLHEFIDSDDVGCNHECGNRNGPENVINGISKNANSE